jgi:hypothetical protein
MGITNEELNFNLASLKALQEQRKATIQRLEQAVSEEEAAYGERSKIIEVLSTEDERTEAIERDLPILVKEQMKRLDNIKTIRDAIREEEIALVHEQEIIKAIEEKS